MKNKFIRKLIEIEIRLGFLHIPAHGIELMPDKNSKIDTIIDGESRKLTYSAQHNRIFGLTGWYKKYQAKPGFEVEIVKDDNTYKIKFKPDMKITKPEDESAKLIDISGLSSISKGDIVEDRIKELIVLQGQGLLSVYKPVTDTRGIDLIVTKSGMFQPIFLQIKGRFNLHKKTKSFITNINKKTFISHHSYYVLGAYFRPDKLEIDDYLLLIPSSAIKKEAIILKQKEQEIYRITSPLDPNSKSKWTKYLVKKSNLANELIEKFEEMSIYIK